ncbi:unnamed protein product [Adineta ricciae]|uniref:Reverse transcriptase domain-containing protein n=1 Tax=Adineta ricciae TaxID=249248 RepID=A0A815PY67_ADIRI|nr:unnamed protein product [Adineta ricciae]
MEASVDGVASRMLHSNPSTLNTSLLYLDVLVNNKQMKAMIDTGANRTFISLQALPRPHTQQFIDKQQRSASLADGQTSLSILGTLELCIDIGDMSTIIKGYVVKELCAECILGMDFISKYKLIINADERTVTMHDDDRCITTTFDVNQRKIRYPARTIRQVYVPPKRTVSIPVNVKISSAKVSFRPSFRLARQTPMILVNNMVVVNHQKSHISLYNPAKYSYTIPEGIVIGTTTVPTLSFNKCLSIDHELVNGYITKLTRHVADPKQADEITNILHHHEKLFDTSKPAIAVNVKPHEIKTLDYPPPTSRPSSTTWSHSQVEKLFDTSKPAIAVNVKPHEIRTLDYPPPTSRPYYSTPQKEEEIYNIVQDLLQHGLIRKSYSPFAAPALLVAKHDGTWRMVVDYKKLNTMTIKDNHPLPNMEQTIRRLGGGYKLFSKLDMKSGFWQIPIKEEDKNKTAFITAEGLKNSPPSYQRVMADILAPCRQFPLVYIDDIVMFSRSFEGHVEHIQLVLSILSKYNFQLNPPKCKLFQRKIEYLFLDSH